MIWLLLGPISLVTFVLLAELVLGLLPDRSVGGGESAVRIAIVIPALDEAEQIGAGIASMIGAGRLLVVADNCTDDTARVARAAGAEVIERHDPAHRGKGFALAFARDHLAVDPPEVVIVVDADCQTDAASLSSLAACAIRHGRPVQAAYLMRARRDRGALVSLSGFAFLVKNLVRQRGMTRLGAPVVLTGSGMAFPWVIFAEARLATDEPVEDLALGVALARAGAAPIFHGGATVWTEAASKGATHDQRGRWERGFLATAGAQTPALLASGRPPLMWLGLHLAVPPLALLVLLHGALLLLLMLLAASAMAWGVELALVAAMLLALAGAWFQHGRGWLSLPMLVAIPFYIVWKLPIYLAALLRKPRSWNRTRRG